LSVLEFKTLKESERAAALTLEVCEKQDTVAMLDKKVEITKTQLKGVREKINFTKQTAATFSAIDNMAKKSLLGGKMELSQGDWQTVLGLAKTGIVAQVEVEDLKHQLADTKKEIRSLKSAYNRLYEETRVFCEALKSAPKRVMAFLQDIISRSNGQREVERSAGKKTRTVHER